MNASIETLTDFLQSTNASFRIFDMGRRLGKLEVQRFQAFEKNEIPYPYPLMRQAWFAVLIWNPKQAGQQQIWFLRFPLDEQGKLVFAARDDLLKRLAQSVGDQLYGEVDPEQDPLKDNPFSFTPDQQRMAAFHAQATNLLKQPASEFLQTVLDYLKPGGDLSQWQNLGIQGIADFCARMDENQRADKLAKALTEMPVEPYCAFCQQLENVAIPHQVASAIGKRIQQTQALASEIQAPIYAHSLRALSQCIDTDTRQALTQDVLNQAVSNDIELLAAIGSRNWVDLKAPALGLSYLQRLAENNAGQESFALMLQDLLFLPEMREPVMNNLRNPERGESLSKAVGAFFQPSH